MDVDYKSDWDELRSQIENHQAFQAITLESERLRIFKVIFILSLPHLPKKKNKNF